MHEISHEFTISKFPVIQGFVICYIEATMRLRQWEEADMSRSSFQDELLRVEQRLFNSKGRKLIFLNIEMLT